jgi:hypothetical protein
MMAATKRGARGVYCSFCWKSRKQVASMIAGPVGVYICDACIGLCSRMLTGKPTAAFAGWDFLSDEEFLAALPAAEHATESAADGLRQHVRELRRRGISWERIATTLGVTRQAAWERFSDDDR